MAQRIGGIAVSIVADTTKFNAGIKKARGGVKSLAGQVASATAIIGTFAVAISEVAKSASDANETLNKFRAVFGNASREMELFAKNLGKTIGRSQYEIQQALATFQSFFVGLGFATDDAAGFSRQLEKLALDFASFHNISDQEAVQRFIAALSGSGEVLDRFGVNIKQAALQQELLAMGVNKSWTAVTEQEKAVARLNIIMRAMTEQGAVGDAAKTAGSFANQVKALNASWEELKVTLGQGVIPVLTDVLSLMVDLSGEISKNIEMMSDPDNRWFLTTFFPALGTLANYNESREGRLNVVNAFGPANAAMGRTAGRAVANATRKPPSPMSGLPPGLALSMLGFGAAGAGRSRMADTMGGMPGFGLMSALGFGAAEMARRAGMLDPRQATSTRALSLAESGTSAGHAQRVAALRQTEATAKKQLKVQEESRDHLRRVANAIAGSNLLVPANLGGA